MNIKLINVICKQLITNKNTDLAYFSKYFKSCKLKTKRLKKKLLKNPRVYVKNWTSICLFISIMKTSNALLNLNLERIDELELYDELPEGYVEYFDYEY